MLNPIFPYIHKLGKTLFHFCGKKKTSLGLNNWPLGWLNPPNRIIEISQITMKHTVYPVGQSHGVNVG
jgi:hypothetical protein